RTKLGADASAAGRSIRLNGALYTVAGVWPARSDFEDYEIFAPEINPQMPRSARFLAQIGRLRPGANLEQVRTELASVALRLQRQYPDTDADVGAYPILLQDYLSSPARLPLLILLGSVTFVLLMACLNVANLFISRNAGRQQEFAVRQALGAGSGRLIRLLLAESLSVAVLGGVIGVAATLWLIELLVRFVPQDLPRLGEVQLNPAVLAFAAIMTLLSGLITGLAPALRLTQAKTQEALRTQGRSTARSGLRQSLVAVQIALSMTLLVGGGLLFRTLWNLENQPTGFVRDHLLTFRLSLPWQMPESDVSGLYTRVLEKLDTIPGIANAALTDRLPFDGNTMSSELVIAGRAAADLPPGSRMDMRVISPEYLSVMGVPLRSGRFLQADDLRLKRTVINQAAVRKYFTDRNPLGEHIALMWGKGPPKPEDMYEVVGVVADLSSSQREAGASPSMYVAYTHSFWPLANFVVRTQDDPKAIAETIRREIATVDSSQAIEGLRTIDDFLAKRNQAPRVQAWLVGIFGMTALLLAAIGVYGVIAGSVADRRFEIGIRMALGAEPATVLRSFLTATLRLTALGMTAGFILSALLTRGMQSVLFGVSSADPTSYLVAAALLLVVVTASAWWPARQAALTNPAMVLRKPD
ncbi:MAG: FtsX-like permease family protein, partial [Bryobacteraceae bacterium]|nr:FtsX-like permease family protein [Bryobacteraceae bacterium]